MKVHFRGTSGVVVHVNVNKVSHFVGVSKVLLVVVLVTVVLI